MARPQPVEDRHPGGPVERKRLGQWFTPDDLVEHVVAMALRRARRPVRRVLDPACGDGRFLAAASRALARRGITPELVGVDVDPGAVAVARRAVPSARIHRADALHRRWGDERFDLIIGNPPFLSQMARTTTRGGRSRFGGGPYADGAAEFLALAAQLADPDGGRVAMVLPRALLASRDAGPIRDAISSQAAIRALWWSTRPMFDAAVHTCAVVLERGGRQGAVRRTRGPAFESLTSVRPGPSWGSLLLDEPIASSAAGSVPAGSPDAGPLTLGSLATFGLDFRDEYYGLVGAVGDAFDGPPLVTCGLIDPGVCHWGQRPVRFAKQRYAAPRVALDRLSPPMQAWAARRLVPKILIANQTRAIEAVVDREGAWLPGVPVITCTPHDPADLDRIAAVLAAPASSAHVVARAAGSGLSIHTVRLTPALLASIPFASTD